jgi:hypothetical protein
MNQLLVVYNICGINKNENIQYYIRAIDSILFQDMDCDVVVSSCLSSRETKEVLQNVYGNRVSFLFVDEVLPVNVTFNLAVLESVKRNGKYDGYMYIDSGIHLEEHDNAISSLYEVFKSGPYGMVAARTNTDTGAELWFGCSDEELFARGPIAIPVGKAVNLHCQIFSDKLLSYYGRLIPDCFASYCTESVFSFLNAALDMKWVIVDKPVVYHLCAMDGGSAGFNPLRHKSSGGDLTNHGFRVDSVHDIMKGGHQYGLGYEECQQILMHDKDKYDENGFCTDPMLKDYIRDNLFLSTDKLDYNTINFTYIGKQ